MAKELRGYLECGILPYGFGRLCFSSRSFSLHAATRVGAKDRGRLEQLCRYVMRPPLAAGRPVVVDEEILAFALKTPWSDGTTHLLLSPQELLCWRESCASM